MSNSPTDNKNPDRKSNPWAQIARYSQLAIAMPTATVVGWAIGVGLDHWLHTTWLYIPGLLIGILAGFVELIRTVMRDSE
jgi:F0F1-type ATP synthase assembly protein I